MERRPKPTSFGHCTDLEADFKVENLIGIAKKSKSASYLYLLFGRDMESNSPLADVLWIILERSSWKN